MNDAIPQGVISGQGMSGCTVRKSVLILAAASPIMPMDIGQRPDQHLVVVQVLAGAAC